MLFDFRVGKLAAEGLLRSRGRHARRCARSGRRRSRRYDWFDLGEELEAVEPSDAEDAYRAVRWRSDPRNADAHVSLGRLLQERGGWKKRSSSMRKRSALSPSTRPPRFNLGTALEDLKRTNAAIAAYRRAIALDEQLADAHHNSSRLYEKTGPAVRQRCGI